MIIKNPILKGFNPDPSIVRVEDTYYIATSTFEWYPGVQIHKSKDLAQWELVTHPLDNMNLLNMTGNPDSGGVWAPDLTYHDGKFWLVYSDVKVVEGAFKDVTNYLITSENIEGPWSNPIKLNGVGFDASLFHDEDGKKYLVQMEWDHREYKNPFGGIRLTEYSVEEKRLLPETSKIIYTGTKVKLTEAPHIYKIFGKYYLFVAEGGTSYSHQETVARASHIYGEYVTAPDTLISAYRYPDHDMQKCGHGSLVFSKENECYFVHLMGRPWHQDGEPIHEHRGWCSLGRETAIQKVSWTKDGWPLINGGLSGQLYITINEELEDKEENTFYEKDDFDTEKLNINFNTLRVPFNEKIGSLRESKGNLRLFGQGSFDNFHDLSLVARRWQHFYFEAETKVKFNPVTFQQMAGMVNYYNSKHWSMVHVTWNEEKGRVIELSQNNRGNYTSFLKEEAISIPEEVEYVYFKTNVYKEKYVYSYSLDGNKWSIIPITLESKILSDDYVQQTYGGFFTGAFVGMACIDYSGYCIPADFDYFIYKEEM